MLRTRSWPLAVLGVVWLTIASQAALPPAPTQLQGSPGNASVGLVWTSPADPTVTQYVVYANATPVAQVAAPETAYLAFSLINGLAYTFAVSAVNPSGEGPISAPVTVYPAVLPQAPAGITATASTLPPQVQLVWTPVLAQTFPLSGYAIYRSVNSVTGAAYAFASASTYTDAAVNTLNASGGYYYQVAAVDQAGNTGAVSAWAQASFLPPAAPAAPTGLSVAASDGQLTLLWNIPPAGVDGYQINLVDTTSNTQSLPTYTNITPYVVPVSNTGDWYNVSVAAIAGGNLSPRTSAMVQALPPSVTDLSIFSGNGYVQISWNPLPAATGTTGYNVYGDSFSSPTTLLNPAPLPLTQISYINPASDTFYYTVRAVNASGVSPQGQTVTAAPAAGTALPVPPTGLSATLGNSRTLALSWNSNYFSDTVTAYRLYSLDVPLSPPWDIPAAAGTNTTVANLINGQNYRFFLTALNANGESASSLTITASPLAPPNNFAAQILSNALLLSWSAGDNPSGVAAYQVFSSTTGFTSMTFLTTTAQTGYTVSPIANGSYFFTLSAVNALGQVLPAAFSSTLTATVNLPPAPPLPIQLTPGNAQVQIIWHTVSDANTYNIYRSTISGVYGPPVQSSIPAKNTLYVDGSQPPALTNTLQYFYTMTTVNDAGESTRSAEYTAIPFLPCQLPTDYSVRASHLRRNVTLTWDASTPGSYPIAGYVINRSQDGGASFKLLGGTGNPPTTVPVPIGSSATAYTYLDQDVAYGTTYEYRIQAVDFDSLHSLSHAGPAYLLVRVPIDFPNNRLDVLRNAFNPAKGETVTIVLSEVQPGHTWVKIYNLAGELIRTLWEGNVDGQYNPDYPFLLNLEWDGKNSRGETVASGVYMIHTEGQAHYHQTRKVAVIK